MGGGACLGFAGGTGSDGFGFGLIGGAEEDEAFGATFSALFGFVSLGFVSSGVGVTMFCSGNSPAS